MRVQTGQSPRVRNDSLYELPSHGVILERQFSVLQDLAGLSRWSSLDKCL